MEQRIHKGERISIDESTDLAIRDGRRVVVEDCVQVLIRNCNEVTVDGCRVDQLKNSVLPDGTKIGLWHEGTMVTKEVTKR